jgi:hypothetical protein
MESSDTTGSEHSYDEKIGAFLARESTRRVRQRPADADVVATIRCRRSRQWPTRTLAGMAAAILLVGLGVVASALVLSPSTDIGSSPSPSRSKPPLRLPAVIAGQPCPVSQPTTPGNGQAPLLGDGPVRLALASADGTAFFEATLGGDWKAIDVLWTAAPDFTGQVLVRGARLDGPDELGFGDPADPLKELHIGSENAQPPGIDGRTVLATTTVRVKAAGCYGLQIDSGELSSIVVFEAKPIEDAFAQLERSLQLPTAGSAGCPLTATTGTVPFIPVALGDGPVYVAGGSTESIANTAQSGGYWFIKEIWIADPGEPGPILVRGGRIDAPGDLRFGDGPEPAAELRFPIHSYEHTGGQPPGWRIFNAYLRPPSPGCYAMQLDTFTGTRWLVFDVTP